MSYLSVTRPALCRTIKTTIKQQHWFKIPCNTHTLECNTSVWKWHPWKLYEFSILTDVFSHHRTSYGCIVQQLSRALTVPASRCASNVQISVDKRAVKRVTDETVFKCKGLLLFPVMRFLAAWNTSVGVWARGVTTPASASASSLKISEGWQTASKERKCKKRWWDLYTRIML